MSLLGEIEACLRLTNVPPSRFGRESVRDPRLVHDLRRGRQPGAAMERRVREYVATRLSALPDSERKAAVMRRINRGRPPAPLAYCGEQ